MLIMPIKESDKKQNLWKRLGNKVEELKSEHKEDRKRIKHLKFEEAEKLIKTGMKFQIKLPEFEVTSRSGTTKAAATAAGGLLGFALASGKTKKRRKINTIMRMAEKGIVIENGDITGADLRIPWENILHVEGTGILGIQLTDGSKIEATLLKLTGPSEKYFAQVINPKCKGVPPEEEGW